MQCLEKLEVVRQGMALDVVLVDQGMVHGIDRQVAAHFSWVHVLLDRSDRGYARSNNVGMLSAQGAFILLLNPDVLVEPATIPAALQWLVDHPRAGYAGVRLTTVDGHLDRACRRSFPAPLVSLFQIAGLTRLFPQSRYIARYNLSYLPEDQPARVDAVAGAFMLLRTAALVQVGLLDETYFMYGEDLDLAMRLHEGGWDGWYLGHLRATHDKGSSGSQRKGRTTYEFYRAMAIFFRRHYAAATPLPATWLILVAILWRGMVALIFAQLRLRRS